MWEGRTGNRLPYPDRGTATTRENVRLGPHGRQPLTALKMNMKPCVAPAHP
jgi:hypothetical protein